VPDLHTSRQIGVPRSEFRWQPAGVIIVLLALVTGASLSASPSLADTTGELDQLRARALELVNQARLERGLEALELGKQVNQAALSHARDMLQRHYYSHTSPGGETVQDRYVQAGGSKWRLTAENIARCEGCPSPPDIGAVERLHSGWMESPEHRRNILRRGLGQFGFGVISDGDREFAVQVFSGPGTPRGLKEGEKAAAVPPAEQTQIVLAEINAARKGEGRPQLASNRTFIELAKSALSAPQSDGLQFNRSMELYDLLPPGERRDWRSLSMLAAACGGCGTEETDADARDFAKQWLDIRQYRERLMDEQWTHFGFSIVANGEGRKIAIGVLAQQR
jgi:uncharacterized protein YkwD